MKTTNCYMSRCFICVNNFRNTNKSIWWYECYQMIDDMNNMCFFIFVYCLMLWIFEIRAIIVAAALSGRGRSNLVAGLATLGDAGMMFEWKKKQLTDLFLYLDDTCGFSIFFYTWMILFLEFSGIPEDTWMIFVRLDASSWKFEINPQLENSWQVVCWHGCTTSRRTRRWRLWFLDTVDGKLYTLVSGFSYFIVLYWEWSFSTLQR